MKSSRLLLSLASVLALSAHPMGNFSVNHYSRIAVGPRGADVLYVLDLAEIPTFQLLQQWKLERASPKEDLDRQAAAQARDWMHHLKITVNGRDVIPQFQSAELKIADGAASSRSEEHTSELQSHLNLVCRLLLEKKKKKKMNKIQRTHRQV